MRNRNRPLKIGITGGIGSGKSVVCQIFRILGVPVYPSDERAKTLMSENHEVIKSIKAHFGAKAYSKEGELNRTYLANHIYNSEKNLKLINSIVHPAVALDFDKWCADHEKESYVIKEAALLVESGSYKELDYIVTVTAPVDLRIKRVLARDSNRTKTQVEQIISNQLADNEKIKRSKFVIRNDHQTLVILQALKIHDFFNSLDHTG